MLRLCITVCRGLFALISPLLCADTAAAQLHANPQTYRALLQKLQPGDELLLAPGTYQNGLPLHDLQGTAAQPIVISGPGLDSPVVFMARSGANTISLARSAHVHVRNLILDGNGLEVDAVKAEGGKQCTNVHHIVLENLLIIGHGTHQGLVGISTKCPAWNWTVRGNIVVGAGTGMYLGNSDGSAPFVGGLIEGNVLLDTLGYNLQIKHQVERPGGIGMPAEQARTVIRHNLFSKTHNAATEKAARPNLLLGHFPRQGPGSDDHYEVTDNLFFCNATEALLQAEGNVTARGNVLVNPAGPGIHIQPHNDVPKAIDVTRNFMATAGRAVSLVKPSPLYKQTIGDNKIVSADTPASPPDFSAALAQWLDATGGGNRFEALSRTVYRLCSPNADAPYARRPWVQGELRDHPACAVMDWLSAARSAAAMQALDVMSRKRCASP